MENYSWSNEIIAELGDNIYQVSRNRRKNFQEPRCHDNQAVTSEARKAEMYCGTEFNSRFSPWILCNGY